MDRCRNWKGGVVTLKERETENSGRFVFPIRLIASKIEGGEEEKLGKRKK